MSTKADEAIAGWHAARLRVRAERETLRQYEEAAQQHAAEVAHEPERLAQLEQQITQLRDQYKAEEAARLSELRSAEQVAASQRNRLRAAQGSLRVAARKLGQLVGAETNGICGQPPEAPLGGVEQQESA